MSFGDERHPEPESWPVPRVLAGPYDAQDAAARAAGLDWHEWAQRVLEAAARGALVPSAGNLVPARAYGEGGPVRPPLGRMVGPGRGAG